MGVPAMGCAEDWPVFCLHVLAGFGFSAGPASPMIGIVTIFNSPTGELEKAASGGIMKRRHPVFRATGYSPVPMLNTSVRQGKHLLACGFTFSVQERSNPGPLAVLTSSLIWLQLESRFNSTTLAPACETACDLRQLRIRKNCMGFSRALTQAPAPRSTVRCLLIERNRYDHLRQH